MFPARRVDAALRIVLGDPVIPIVNSLVPQADRRQVFARRYEVLN